MNRPLISIITIVYNNERGIEKTISSVINQTYNNIEYIIIDGGSNDQTVPIIKKYNDKIDYWISEPDNGIYNAMNKGIKVAKGEYLNFMNSGDTFTKNTIIEEIMNLKEENDAIIYGNIIKCYKYHTQRSCGITKSKPDIVDFYKNTIHHQSAFIKKELFNKYGLYEEKYKLASDWLFFIIAVGIGKEKVHYCKLDIAYFMMDGSSSIGKNKYTQEKETMKHKLFPEYDYIFKELSEYRSSTILTKLLNIRLKMKGNTLIKTLVHSIKSFFPD